MNEKNRNLVVRIVSALLLLPIVLFMLWAGGWWTVALVAIASAIVASELYGIVGIRLTHPAAVFGILASASMAVFAPDFSERWPAAIAVLVATPVASLSLMMLRPPDGDLRAAAQQAAFAALAPPYAGLCLAAVAGLRAIPDELPAGPVPRGFLWILVALFLTWGNDTGAYFAGRLFGRRKLYEKVSPGKTWEGFVGGMALSVAVAFAISLWFTALRPQDCVILGMGCSVLGPAGDLAESMVKRAFGAKDSGKIMPGHGGIYDRIDALLFTAPFVYAYALWLEGWVG